MTRSDFVAANPIVAVLESKGIQVRNKMAKCPFHDDKNASMSVDPDKGLFYCHACKTNGSVIDLMAKFANQDAVQFLKENNITADGHVQPVQKPSPSGYKIAKIYQYKDSLGRDAYQVCRLEPKSFRQRRPDGKGGWIWNMDGVERFLYRLPEVLNSNEVVVVEGEKDAETAVSLGYCGTTNVGGAGKWMEGYTESLKGKNIIIVPDNDKPGEDHCEKVLESIAGKVRSVKIIHLPDGIKDLSDWVAAQPSIDDARMLFGALVASAVTLAGGVRLPMLSMAEIEPSYLELAKNLERDALDLSKWLPSMKVVRPLVPGELAMVVGDTGIGKTAILSTIMMAYRTTHPTLFFEMELPATLMFERIIAASIKQPGWKVEEAYRNGDTVGYDALSKMFAKLLICPESRLTVDRIEALINKADLKLGERPKLVLIDYVQLIGAPGSSRYERASKVAEDLKIMAKATNTIVFIASQVTRKQDEGDRSREIGLHDAKDSGSLENSCGLVIGAWREMADPSLLTLRVLKATKGGGGTTIKCNFNGPQMSITERTNPY